MVKSSEWSCSGTLDGYDGPIGINDRVAIQNLDTFRIADSPRSPSIHFPYPPLRRYRRPIRALRRRRMGCFF